MGELLYYYNDKSEARPFTHPCHFVILLSLGRAAVVVICGTSACQVVPSEGLVTTIATFTSPLSSFFTAPDLAAPFSVSWNLLQRGDLTGLVVITLLGRAIPVFKSRRGIFCGRCSPMLPELSCNSLSSCTQVSLCGLVILFFPVSYYMRSFWMARNVLPFPHPGIPSSINDLQMSGMTWEPLRGDVFGVSYGCSVSFWTTLEVLFTCLKNGVLKLPDECVEPTSAAVHLGWSVGLAWFLYWMSPEWKTAFGFVQL